MNLKDKQKIYDYLCGPRDYREGVDLYRAFGPNLRLRRQFEVEETRFMKSILIEELRKLAGLSQVEFDRLPRLAHKPSMEADSMTVSVKVVSDDAPEGEDPEEESENTEAPEPVRKMIAFREKYPFLKDPACPQSLKILVSDLFTAYGRYKEAFSRLQEIPDDETAAAMEEARKTVEAYIENKEIWEELDYYRDNGAILGKSALFRTAEEKIQLEALSDLDLSAKLKSATVNVSKHRKAVADAVASGTPDEKAEAALAKWTERKRLFQEELDRRKKSD